MAEIASWNGHSFTVSPKLIRGFTGLTIKGSSETEDKTSDGQKYVSRKNSNPSEITLTAELNALTGCDVKNEALKFVDEARSGAKNYFYMGGKKLITCQLMLTEASVSETTIAPNGTWISCKVKLTMKQCAKYDGTGSSSSSSSSSSGSSSSSSGSKKTSTKKTSTTTTKKTTTAAVVGAVAGAVAAVAKTATTVVKAVSAASKTASALKTAVAAVNNAKKTSSTTKKTSVVSKVTSAIKNKIKALKK
mgnify:FL=1|jgi:hypothetical protein|nr:MAG TPA: hypothetical protein [Caudoviricetes sp.]